MTEVLYRDRDGLGIHRAISKITEELSKEGISKDKKNITQNYAFRGIDDVYNALAPRLAAAKLSIYPKVQERIVETRMTKSGGALYNVALRVDFHFVAAEDGSREIVTMFGEAMDSADKATNKALSAAYKYACIQTFCIPTAGENDADAHTPEETVPVAVAPKPLLGAKPIVDPKQAYDDRKAEYAIDIEIMPDGQPNYEAFAVSLELAVENAKNMGDVSMLKKANSTMLNKLKVDDKELFDKIVETFTKVGNTFK